MKTPSPNSKAPLQSVEELGEVSTPTPPKVGRGSSTPWLDIAVGEIGQKEIKGRRHNARVLQYHAATTYNAKTDEVPWCASFVAYCLEEAGIRSTRSARARSYESWGKELKEPLRGCLVVFWRGTKSSGKGHIGFYMGMRGDRIQILGGNQADQVKISNLKTDKILSYRWPSE